MKSRHRVVVGLALIVNTCLIRSASASPGPAEGTTALIGNTDDRRLFTGDGDWRYGFHKTECGPDFPTMVGLAARDLRLAWPESGYYWTATDSLCATSNTLWVDYDDGTSNWFGDSDRRRDTSTGDWAPQLVKAECGSNEVLTGWAEQEEGINEFRCSAAYTAFIGDTLVPTSCDVVDFDHHDGYEPWYYPTPNRGDWASGRDKGNCGANRYIKGFAVDSLNGTTRPVKVLCCGAQQYAAGQWCSNDEQCLWGCGSNSQCNDEPPVK